MTLRVGINFGNALLATRPASSGEPTGISIDLAHELGRRVNAVVEIVGYDSASVMADGAGSGAWDVAFLAIDQARAAEIEFSPPYLEIEATYLVPPQSPLLKIGDVDQAGVRIAVSDRSAYDLFLTRTIQRAQLVRAPSVQASVALFFERGLEALAGLKPLLVGVADHHRGTTVLEGRFTDVRQAIGVSRGRQAVDVERFVTDVKASGLVAQAVERHGLRGIVVPSS